MKKFFFLTGIFLIAASITTAQHPQFGLKAGVNISKIDIDDGNDLDSKAGFYLGGLAHIHMTRHFALQPELMFSAQGGESGSITAKRNYINMPVLLQYMTNTGFRLQTGPQLGFLVSAKNESGNVSANVKDQLNTADIAWAFGASYITRSGFGVDARYNLGFTNMNESETPKAHNRVWQLGAFYQFRH